MNKNTVLAIVLIGAILLGFSWYNNKEFKKQAEIKRVQDSIAMVKAAEYSAELAAKQAESGADPTAPLAPSEIASGSGYASKEQYNYVYDNPLLDSAYKASPELVTIENNKIKVEFTTRGAQANRVLIKDYYTYDSLDLYLLRDSSSRFGIQFYTSQAVNTSDFNFVKHSITDSTASFRLYFSEVSYVEHIYTLHHDSYLMDFDFKLVGMDKFIPRNVPRLGVQWLLNVPRLEKGYDNEKNYSTVVYKYPNENKVETLGLRKGDATKSLPTRISWFAFQQQFFSAILIAEKDFSSSDLSFKFYENGDPSGNLMYCTANSQVEYAGGSEEVTIPFKFYYGPNHFKTLKSYGYGFEKIVPLGGALISWINRFAIIPMFDLFSRFIGNFGIIILLMTLVIKIVVSPLTIKSYISSAKMRVLKPEIEKINAKYPKQDDAVKKQQETMDLYKRSGVSMFGGCLPMLLQFPILFAMFRFFPASIELRQEGFLWIKDLSAYDSIWDMPFKIPLYGDHVSLVAILMAISMFFYARMTADQMDNNPQMKSMKYMNLYFMPIFMLLICNNFSSGLSYYYMLSNLMTILQTWIIRKYFVDEEKLLAKLKENSAKAVTKPKSKFQQRLEAAQKAQQQAMKDQQRRR